MNSSTQFLTTKRGSNDAQIPVFYCPVVVDDRILVCSQEKRGKWPVG